MRRVTNHFMSFGAAFEYYKMYEPGVTNSELLEIVGGKKDRGEIVVGPPPLLPGETIGVDADGRFYIEGTPI